MGSYGLANLLVLLLFGTLVPWFKGLEFLDTSFLLVYALLGCVFVVVPAARAAVQGGAGYAAFVSAIVVSWGQGVLILLLSLGTLAFKYGNWLQPPRSIFLCLMVLGLSACLLCGSATFAATQLLRDAGRAVQAVRFTFFAVLCLLFAVPRSVEAETWSAILNLLTPEGLLQTTLLSAPAALLLAWVLLSAAHKRYTK